MTLYNPKFGHCLKYRERRAGIGRSYTFFPNKGEQISGKYGQQQLGVGDNAEDLRTWGLEAPSREEGVQAIDSAGSPYSNVAAFFLTISFRIDLFYLKGRVR